MNDPKDIASVMNMMSGVYTPSAGFDWSVLMAWLIFGVIGFAAFRYGKKEKAYKAMSIGIALMVYPYVVKGTFWTWGLGIGLCALLYFWRD